MIGLFIILIFVLFLTVFSEKSRTQFRSLPLYYGGCRSFGQWHDELDLIEKALVDPINITLAVFIAGIITKWAQTPWKRPSLEQVKP